MLQNNKILLLTLYTFNLTGGIEKVCRSLSRALADLQTEALIADYQVMSMYDNEADLRYVAKSKFKGFRGHRLRFGLNTIIKGLTSNIIIISHVNLLLFGWLIKKIRPKTRIIILAHGIEIWKKQSHWKTKFLRQHTEIWAVSRYTAEVIQAQHNILPANIKILNNALDPFFELPKTFEKPQYLMQRYGLNPDHQVLFTLSRLSFDEQYKGYDQILKLMPDLPDHIHYILAGKADDQERKRIESLIAHHQLQNRVKLTGFVPEEELTDHFLLADVYVMPSKAEGFGVSFIEAAACGCKIVAGEQDGSRDALLNGELGELVDPENLESILSGISKALNKTNLSSNKHIQKQKTLMHFSFNEYKNKLQKLLSN